MIRLFKVFIPVATLTLLISEVLLVTSAFIFATYVVLEVDPSAARLEIHVPRLSQDLGGDVPEILHREQDAGNRMLAR